MKPCRGASVYVMLLLVVCLVGISPSAHAAFKLRLDQQGDSLPARVITDNDILSGDFSMDSGRIIFSGSVGVWTVSFTMATSKPLLGGPHEAMMSLVSFQATSHLPLGQTATLSLETTDTGFSISPPFSGTATSRIGGLTAGTTTYNTYIDSSNSEFGTGTSLASMASLGPGTFNSEGSQNNVILSNPFSLTLAVTVTHVGTGVSGEQQSTFGSDLSVQAVETIHAPEPQTLLLVGTGLLGFAGYSWRRRGQRRNGK